MSNFYDDFPLTNKDTSLESIFHWLGINDTIKVSNHRIEELKKENTILRDSYNSLARDVGNGEHVEFSWIKEAIDEAAHSHLVRALNNKIKRLENKNT